MAHCGLGPRFQGTMSATRMGLNVLLSICLRFQSPPRDATQKRINALRAGA